MSAKPKAVDPRDTVAGEAIELALAADELAMYVRRVIMPTLGAVTAAELGGKLATYEKHAKRLSRAWDSVEALDRWERNGPDAVDLEDAADRAAEVNAPIDDVEPF